VSKVIPVIKVVGITLACSAGYVQTVWESRLLLRKAFGRLKSTDKPILHSDQGWQYQMPNYRRYLKEQEITPSMSRKGNCYDNAAMESFFGTLKAEYYHINEFRDLDELQAGIKEYIRYYNHDRIKLKLGGLSPVDFRVQSSSA